MSLLPGAFKGAVSIIALLSSSIVNSIVVIQVTHRWQTNHAVKVSDKILCRLEKMFNPPT